MVDMKSVAIYSRGLIKGSRMSKEITDCAVSPLVKAIKEAYRSGQEDEELEPIVVTDSSRAPLGRIQPGDAVIFYDIRGEREIQITESLTEKEFDKFEIKKNLNLDFVTMIEYATSLDVQVAFPPEGEVRNTFAEVVTKKGLSLVKVAESEKAIHVGYFMNGKNENPFPGETRILIPSPEGIDSYAQTPEMSAEKVTESLIAQLDDPAVHVVVGNLANVDVLGHIEDRNAVLSAVEVVDRQLARLVDECRKRGITVVVTADHGTVEEWQYADGTVNTGHTKNPVPFICADFALEDPKSLAIEGQGELSDVAPTLLEILGLEKQTEMTGCTLIKTPGYEKRENPKLLLLILDGWGIKEDPFGNLIHEANTPNFDRIWAEFPHSTLEASGEAVGMPANTVGNSEAGHLHLGAGRRILLDRVRIDKSIEEGSFSENTAFLWAMQNARNKNRALHLLGIVSFYSSHGTIDHLFALLEMAKNMGLTEVYVHSLIGRRGERPESGSIYVDKVEKKCRSLSTGRVVTVMGRFWALDREENWDRVEKAYRALVFGDGTPAAELF
jgi:2,3-bisphosphoglycerate-independent phosphoglycerate mutase